VKSKLQKGDLVTTAMSGIAIGIVLSLHQGAFGTRVVVFWFFPKSWCSSITTEGHKYGWLLENLRKLEM